MQSSECSRVDSDAGSKDCQADGSADRARSREKGNEMKCSAKKMQSVRPTPPVFESNDDLKSKQWVMAFDCEDKLLPGKVVSNDPKSGTYVIKFDGFPAEEAIESVPKGRVAHYSAAWSAYHKSMALIGHSSTKPPQPVPLGKNLQLVHARHKAADGHLSTSVWTNSALQDEKEAEPAGCQPLLEIDWLKKWLKARGTTQGEFSRELGISPSAMSEYMRNKTSSSMAQRISDSTRLLVAREGSPVDPGAESGSGGRKPQQLVPSTELLSFVHALARAPERQDIPAPCASGRRTWRQ